MQLKKLYFKDKSTGWCLQEAEFSPFTLLVGASGVGKTRILQAIKKIANIATGDSYNGVAWKATFVDSEQRKIVWSGETEYTSEKYDFSQMPYDFSGKNHTDMEFNFLSELLTVDDVEIFKRENSYTSYRETKTIKLQNTRSLFYLLREDEFVLLRHNFANIEISKNEFYLMLESIVLSFGKEHKTFEDLIENSPFELLPKLCITSTLFPNIFQEIKEEFCNIFPFVEDLQFRHPKVFRNAIINPAPDMVALHLKEKGSDEWIGSWDFSSGMQKTLALIIQLFLSPKGSILLIDEFENSFGVNCIESISKIVIHSAQDKQIILTSHHPYIINNIPSKHWKLVTRKNSNVSISSVQDKLSTRSKHDAFIQLINLDQYAEGIEP